MESSRRHARRLLSLTLGVNVMTWLEVPVLLAGLAFFFMKVERLEERMDNLKNDILELSNDFKHLPKRKDDRDN